MRAVVVTKPGSATVERVADPNPLADEVIVKVMGCGICGTDLHILHEGLPNLPYPVIPGHEPWGEVVATGKNENSLRIGDRVAIDPSIHCGACARCQRGRGNLCLHWGAIGGTRSGAWAEFVAVPQNNIHLLEEGFPLDCAAIIEPIACALRGIAQLKPQLDTPALIFGAGTMGMLLALLLDMRGAGPVTVVEMNEERARIARELLPATVIHTDALGDLQAEIVIDATGNPRAIETALQHVAYGGTMLVFGVASPAARVRISPYDIYEREITVLGSKAILHTFGPAVDCVRRHAARFKPLIAQAIFPLEHFDGALAAMHSGPAVKIVLAPNA